MLIVDLRSRFLAWSVAIILVVACGSAPASPPSTSSAAKPSAGGSVASKNLPVVADVPFFRADSTRSAIHPGPGPIDAPALAWQRQLDGYASLFPIVVDGRLIVGTVNGTISALDARTGHVDWSLRTSSAVGASAAAAEGVVYVPDESHLYAVDVQTGTEIWSAEVISAAAGPELVDA